MLEQVLAFYRGGRVKRFHALDTVVQQTVAEHSHNVAWWVLLLAGEECSTALLKAALMHDTAEQATGDAPAPVKRALGVSEGYAKLEQEFLQKHGLSEPVLSAAEHRILTLADKLDGIVHCCRERQLGNKEVEVCYWRYTDYITTMELSASEFEAFQTALKVYPL
jgi:5'-deoxynucleotidase YfbR-like HD superfamily hydrolase